MVLFAPIWLLALLPWGAVCAYVLLGRRSQTAVPFLQLWKFEQAETVIRRRFSTPPLGLALALLAAGLAIVAASQPGFRSSGTQRILVVLDTGATMSAKGSSEARYIELSTALADTLARLGHGSTSVRVVSVFGGPEAETTVANLPTVARSRSPSAADTSTLVGAAIARATANSGELVIVISDRPVPAGTQAVQLSPDRPVQDVSVDRLAVRRRPLPQAEVRIVRTKADAPRRAVSLRLTVGTETLDRTIDPPPPGESRDYFFDLPASSAHAAFADVRLQNLEDDFSGNNRAYAAANQVWPVLLTEDPPGDLERLIRIYERLRPATDSGIRVRFTSRPRALGEAVAGVYVPPIGTTTDPARPTAVADHPITAAVSNWPDLELPAAANRAAPEGFQSILADKAGPLVAIRELRDPLAADRPVRQVWTAISTARWAHRPEYVLFWSAAIDWAGLASSGANVLTAAPVAEWRSDLQASPSAAAPEPAERWPGFYVAAGQDTRVAFSADPMPDDGIVRTAEDWRAELDVALTTSRRTYGLAQWVAMAALAAALGSAGSWRGRMRHRPPASWTAADR